MSIPIWAKNRATAFERALYGWTYFQAPQLLERCESPLEHLFTLAVLQFARIYDHRIDESATWPITINCGLQSGGSVPVVVNHQVQLGGFRADFTVQAGSDLTVIELDGFTYHERSPIDAQRDRQRDRRMVSGGNVVLRFMTAEIMANPFVCVCEAMAIVLDRCEGRPITPPREVSEESKRDQERLAELDAQFGNELTDETLEILRRSEGRTRQRWAVELGEKP